MAEIFIRNIALAAYYEDAMSECANWTKEEEIKNDVRARRIQKAGKICANYLVSDIIGMLDGKAFVRDAIKITPEISRVYHHDSHRRNFLQNRENRA